MILKLLFSILLLFFIIGIGIDIVIIVNIIIDIRIIDIIIINCIIDITTIIIDIMTIIIIGIDIDIIINIIINIIRGSRATRRVTLNVQDTDLEIEKGLAAIN